MEHSRKERHAVIIGLHRDYDGEKIPANIRKRHNWVRRHKINCVPRVYRLMKISSGALVILSVGVGDATRGRRLPLRALVASVALIALLSFRTRVADDVRARR